MEFTSVTGVLLQILTGVIVTYIIYLIGLYITRSNSIVSFKSVVPTKKTETMILDGVLNSSEIANRSFENKFNTTIPFLRNYMPIVPSLNTKGGAQFSYSFWIYVGDPIKARGKTIFLKGDKKRYRYTQTNHIGAAGMLGEWNARKEFDRVVFAPMVSFGNDNMDFDIKFNTFHNMNETIHVRRIESENSLTRNNLQSLFSKTWFRMTIVFEDNIPISDFENGILVRVYLNDNLYQIEKIASTLRQNRGDLEIFPDGAIQNCKIANMKYYNYALSDAEIKNDMASKPDIEKTASSTTKKNDQHQSFETVAKNHLDIYNR